MIGRQWGDRRADQESHTGFEPESSKKCHWWYYVQSVSLHTHILQSSHSDLFFYFLLFSIFFSCQKLPITVPYNPRWICRSLFLSLGSTFYKLQRSGPTPNIIHVSCSLGIIYTQGCGCCFIVSLCENIPLPRIESAGQVIFKLWDSPTNDEKCWKYLYTMDVA